MRCNIRPAAWIVAGILLFIAGCTDKSTNRFVTPSGSAKQALETALNAWKAGRPAGAIDGTPQIEAYDRRWQAGDKLAGFEITGEDVNAEGHRRFNVKLTMRQPAGVVETKYVVLGENPISVHREEDYLKLSGQ